jgi:hypothetical protein
MFISCPGVGVIVGVNVDVRVGVLEAPKATEWAIKTKTMSLIEASPLLPMKAFCQRS